jgi:hypothetical protein
MNYDFYKNHFSVWIKDDLKGFLPTLTKAKVYAMTFSQSREDTEDAFYVDIFINTTENECGMLVASYDDYEWQDFYPKPISSKENLRWCYTNDYWYDPNINPCDCEQCNDDECWCESCKPGYCYKEKQS